MLCKLNYQQHEVEEQLRLFKELHTNSYETVSKEEVKKYFQQNPAIQVKALKNWFTSQLTQKNLVYCFDNTFIIIIFISYNAFDQKWSNIELSIDDFYRKVLIWMILPFIPREIESTGMEFLMNEQVPPKNRYQNLIDLEISNVLVQNKETYLFIPEDINLFIQQYEKILQKIVDDVRVQSNNFSSGSAYKASKSEYQEIEQFNAVTIFNEKLCVFFYDEHLKRHQAFSFAQTRQSEMLKIQAKPSSRSSIQEKQSSNSQSQEDSEQLKTKAERIYQDRYSRYIEKFSPQDFHPIPVNYSVSYEEFRYRKNEIDHKQQIFVVELVVNEQQLLNTEKGYRRQLRDTIKQIYQSYQQKKQLLEQQTDEEDSISVQANISEEKSVHDKKIINYQFPSHPSHYIDEIYQVENKEILNTDQIYSPRQDENGDLFLLSNRSKHCKPLLEIVERNSKDQHRKSQVSIQSEHSVKDVQFKGSRLNLTEKEIAQSVFIKFSQRKKQQQFYNENESKLPQESKHSQQQIFEEYQVKYTENLKLFEAQYNLVQQQLNSISNPYSYRIQRYLFLATFILIVCYIILISTSTQEQYDFSSCLNLIELMITTQTSFSQITHSLYMNEIQNLLSIQNRNVLNLFYRNQFFAQLQELINIQSDYAIQINKVNFHFEQFYDIENQIQQNKSLQEMIQLSLGQFYKLKHSYNNDSFIVDKSLTLASVANLQEVGQLPLKAYKFCYQENLDNQNYSQNILIVYTVLTFFLVMILQFTQIPLIGKLRRNHRTLYKEILNLQTYEVNDEIEIYDTVVNIFKKSIYEWMLIDFLQETQMFEINRQRTSISQNQGLTKINNSDLKIPTNSNKKCKSKLMEKLKKSKMKQNKYITILMVGLLVILVYFLVVFLIIFMLSKDTISNIDALFQSKLAHSSIINLINNIDLLAYSSIQQGTYENVMNITQFKIYSTVLSDNSTDIFFEEYNNQLLSSFLDQSLQNNFNILNEENICKLEVGINCSQTDAIVLNPQIIAYYEQGMKSLLTQISSIIAQYPQFYDAQNFVNSQKQTLIDFYNNQQHILYIDYGSEIIIKAYQQILTIEKSLFNQLLDLYRKLLLIFTLSVGLFGLFIIFLLGKYLLKLQKDSIETCITAVLLVSPKRYLSKQLGLVFQKKL